ncbi:MAG: hypothetical protein PHN42_04825 [Bacilli bacterium]|nr:hypothetical protein [Bacilli bacterium]
MKKILIITLILSLLTGCNDKIKEENDNIISNINESIKITQNVDGIIFSNQSIMYQNNVSTITFEIQNTLNYEKKIKKIYISVKNENNTEIVKLESIVDIKLNTKKSTLVNVYSDIDLSKSYQLEFSYE